ncbi:MAG: hypothetical protein IJ523_06155 [Succinivibrionaceae bacterium]|nr:hypothetical protein [Succinivibrionaceae bacterium]
MLAVIHCCTIPPADSVGKSGCEMKMAFPGRIAARKDCAEGIIKVRICAALFLATDGLCLLAFPAISDVAPTWQVSR